MPSRLGLRQIRLRIHKRVVFTIRLGRQTPMLEYQTLDHLSALRLS
jgi:hypothetical protein